MDCSAEEQLIRVKLGGNEAVEGLHFDLPGRQLAIFHTGAVEPLTKTLEGIRLNSALIVTADAGLSELTQDAPADR